MKQISGRAIRTGVPLPPPAGPGRDRMLWRDGRAALVDSVRSYAESCRLLSVNVGVDLSDIPTWTQTTGDLAWRGVHEIQAQQRHLRGIWEPTARRLCLAAWRRSEGAAFGVARGQQSHMSRLDRGRYNDQGFKPPTPDAFAAVTTVGHWLDAERFARQALVRAVDAFNFLELTPGHDIAHHHAHEVAAFVGGIFGCEVPFEGGEYWDTCPVSLMHHRWGISIGFTAERLCSLCGEDLDECPHMIDTSYEVLVASASDGTCTACGELLCNHVDGEIMHVCPHAMIREASLHEVSLVRNPRDPLARITRMDITSEVLRQSLGTDPAGRPLACYRCLHPCRGFSFPID